METPASGFRALRTLPKEGAMEDGSSQTPIFLLAEFKALQDARALVITVRDRQINLYIALASLLAAASAVGQAIVQPGNKQVYVTSVGLALIAFAMFGVVLAYRIVQNQLSSTVYLRGMNRIRNYFTTKDQDLLHYLVNPINDDTPLFTELSFSTGPLSRVFGIDIFAFLNGGAAHLGSSLLVIGALPLDIDRRPWFLASFLFAFAWLSAQLFLHRRQIQQAKLNYDVVFPSSGDDPSGK
jgi:hypothetical protein